VFLSSTVLHIIIIVYNGLSVSWTSLQFLYMRFRQPFWNICRSQWPRGLRRRSAVARLLRSWVRILPGAWMFVCCECCVLSGRDLCDELITRPEESYRLWCVVVSDLENLVNEEAMTRAGSQRHRKQKLKYLCIFTSLPKSIAIIYSTFQLTYQPLNYHFIR
jgi:hypothetical protein